MAYCETSLKKQNRICFAHCGTSNVRGLAFKLLALSWLHELLLHARMCWGALRAARWCDGNPGWHKKRRKKTNFQIAWCLLNFPVTWGVAHKIFVSGNQHDGKPIIFKSSWLTLLTYISQCHKTERRWRASRLWLQENMAPKTENMETEQMLRCQVLWSVT